MEIPFDTFSGFWDEYKLEIIWLLLGLILVLHLWRFIKEKQGPGLKWDGSQTFQVKLKSKYRWNWLLVASAFPVLLGIDIVRNFDPNNYREPLIDLGSAIFLGMSIYSGIPKKLKLKINGKKLLVDNDEFISDEIAYCELWDNLIFLETRDGEENKFWINYSKNRFKEMVSIIHAIQKYCEFHKVRIENNFDDNLKTNTTFIRKPITIESIKAWHKEWSKIPPRQPLED